MPIDPVSRLHQPGPWCEYCDEISPDLNAHGICAECMTQRHLCEECGVYQARTLPWYNAAGTPFVLCAECVRRTEPNPFFLD